MKKHLLLTLVSLLSLVAVNETFCSYLNITNGTPKNADVRLVWIPKPGVSTPADDVFTLPPGHSKRIYAGIFDLSYAEVDGNTTYFVTPKGESSEIPKRWGLRVVETKKGREVITNKRWMNSLSAQEVQQYFDQLRSLEGSPEIGTFGQKNPQAKL